jgi:hypothetical protein
VSTAAGIAAVSAVLKDLLINGLIDQEAGTIVGGEVLVTALAPDRIRVPEEKSQLNLFLYLVMPNQGWRNEGLPSRDSRGMLVSAPPLALDLYYLLTAYGTRDLHAETLLGYGMKLLHEMPVLTRPAIRLALSPTLPIDGGASIPPELRDLVDSGLADQIEQIKVAPHFLTTEEMFKLWMAFQAPYRPTASYRVSVVLIESQRQGRRPLPVRVPKVYVVPSGPPAIEEVRAETGPGEPITTASVLVIRGHRLRGDTTVVKIGGVEIPAASASVTDNEIRIPLATSPPLPPAVLRSGLRAVQVVHRVDMGTPAVPHLGIESNVASFVLRPTITIRSVDNVQGVGATRSADVTVQVDPAIGATQRVQLLLNQLAAAAPAAYLFVAPSRVADTASIKIPVAGVTPGTYLARLSVDGAESVLTRDTSPPSPPGDFVGPTVTVS